VNSIVNKDAQQILDRFHELTPWTRFDEWSGICIELSSPAKAPGTEPEPPQYVCAFFGEDQEADYRLLVLRGSDPAFQYLQYRSGDWVPEFGLDFATTNGIKINISEDQVDSYDSHKPGQPPEPLRLDEKQVMFEVLDAISTLAQMVDEDKIPVLGETEDYCYHLWKVASTWRADVRDFPDEDFFKYDPIVVPHHDSRLKRIKAAGLLQNGIWEASSFYLPATRFQGDQEVFVQCAGIAERNAGLLGLVTLEAHADPEQEIAEALIGSIETQKRIPQFLIVKEEKVAERLLPILETLGIHVKLRKRLRDLAHIREEMIEEFPEEENTDVD
jgi:hypothetical protein